MAITRTQQAGRAQAPQTRRDPMELFRDAVALKRSGDVDGALAQLNEAVEQGATYGPLLQARAGYTALAGDVAHARQLMAEVPVPTDTSPGEFNGARVDYSINLAWFSALVGDDAAVPGHLRDALQLGGGEKARPYVEDFVATEPDLARLRDTPAVKAALVSAPATSVAQATASVDVGNTTERAAANDFAANTGTPATGASLMQTRIAAMTSKPDAKARGAEAEAALGSLAALVPNAKQAAGAPGAAIAEQLTKTMRSDLVKGERVTGIDTQDLRKLTTAAFGSERKGMKALTATLEELGYKAQHDGFSSSLSIGLPTGGAPADSASILDGLRALSPPSSSDDTGTADAVAQLVRTKVNQASQAGEVTADLETGELDRALSKLGDRSGAYDVVAAQLKRAGYSAFADGFIGVSFDWKQDDAKPDAAQGLADFRAAMPAPDELAGGTPAVVALLQERLTAAQADGETRAHLDTSDLDPLLKGTGVKYDDIASVLEEAGFSAFADGFTGVSLRWD